MLGLYEVVEAAVKLHNVTLLVDPGKPGDVATLRCGNGYGYGLEVVYAAGGYDLWNDGELFKTDLTVDQAAFAIVNAYMWGKATLVLNRDFGMGGEEIGRFLKDDSRRVPFFELLDKGSDTMRAKFIQAATS